MINTTRGEPKSYSVVITRDDGTPLMIESGLSKDRADDKRMLISTAFRNVVVIEMAPVNPPAAA